MTETVETVEILYCENHPSRETTLRCNRCEKPICINCALRTPTGYRCKECVRGLQKKFDNASWYDYMLGFFAAGFLSFIGSLVMSFIGSFFFGLFVLIASPVAGAAIARGLQPILRGRRSRNLYLVTAAGVVAGGLPMVFFTAIPLFSLLFSGLGDLTVLYAALPAVWQVVYLAIAAPTVYTRLSGIQLK